jgi:hypothetical protein
MGKQLSHRREIALVDQLRVPVNEIFDLQIVIEFHGRTLVITCERVPLIL